jgi:outer membrane protein
MRKVFSALLALGAVQIAFGQTPLPKLTLKDAQALAIKNHPQVLAAESEVGFANQQVIETRSAYYPTVAADVTASAANQGSRIGAGALTDSRLFNRFGQGVSTLRPVTKIIKPPATRCCSK